jgi:hypothetical protein
MLMANASCRVFECEVMPTLIYLLRSALELQAEEVRLEFGCVVVYACPRSCGKEGDYAYEYVHLQQAL